MTDSEIAERNKENIGSYHNEQSYYLDDSEAALELEEEVEDLILEFRRVSQTEPIQEKTLENSRKKFIFSIFWLQF